MPTLKLKNGTTTYDVKLYDSVEGTGTDNTDRPVLKVKMDGKTYYGRMSATLTDATGGDTPLHFKYTDGKTYQVVQRGEFTITIPSSANQTVSLTVNGKTYSGAQTVWVKEGDTFTASATADSGYTAGVVTPGNGTVSGNVALTVADATADAGIPGGTKHMTLYSGANPTKFTVPDMVNVISVAVLNNGSSKYIKVTPNSIISFVFVIMGDSGSLLAANTNTGKTVFVVNHIEAPIGAQYIKIRLYWASDVNNHATDFDLTTISNTGTRSSDASGTTHGDIIGSDF